ncbi:ABC transporter permease [Candidatus Halocynthiibacter alkanivorans]|jgi:ABC-type nitrate/sulfonate/bicarbonate transport system permease component|uniref:ABC transporter permease n=1 Tax=Candidatus Halocynthiibacter alkanivorans TaxID=2267619 RepID=UPI000DF33699|nr:ABC transporter permease subunit [Candidatus Halocynthiibacter alkanivorans]
MLAATSVTPHAKGEKSDRLFGMSDTLFYRILSVLIVFGVWEIAGMIPISIAFPTFSSTMAAMFEMIFDGRLIYAYGETLKPLGMGVAISAFFGVTIGVSMGLNRLSQWVWEPIFVVLQASPVAALIPLITYAYGIGITAKTVAVIMLAAPIIVLNTYKAVRNANPSLIQMCRSFQGTRLQEIWIVIVPNAAPVIFAGLRLGVAAGFIGVILAELLITPTGIGDLISYHRSIAEYDYMYAAVFTIIVFSAVMVGFLETVEIKYFRPEKKKV